MYTNALKFKVITTKIIIYGLIWIEQDIREAVFFINGTPYAMRRLPLVARVSLWVQFEVNICQSIGSFICKVYRSTNLQHFIGLNM